jgi:Ca2+-binding RTX toxin-like protein
MIRMKNIPRLLFILFGVLVITSVGFAFAANIVVPTTRLTDQTRSVDPNTLKPAACSGITLNAIVICTGGNCNGSNADELILGTAGDDNIKAKNGDDCIVGGGGDDDISGDNGTNVCIGGPGNDTFSKCDTEIQ